MLKEKIREVVHRMGDVSFPELLLRFPEASGESGLYGVNESLLIWEGLSQECVSALQSLLSEGAVVLRWISATKAILIHSTVHKGGLNYPVATRVQKYAKPHWLPAILCKPSISQRSSH